MELLKNYRVVITVVLIVLVLVVIRSAGVNHFKNDAKELFVRHSLFYHKINFVFDVNVEIISIGHFNVVLSARSVPLECFIEQQVFPIVI